MQSERMGPKGDVLPASCKIGDSFVLVVRSANQATLHMCFSDNVWTACVGNDPILAPAIVVAT